MVDDGMTLTAARAIALEALARTRLRDAWARSVLDPLLDASDLSPSDRAFTARLVYGVVQTYGTLDEALDRFIPRPGDVQPTVRDALRMAAWELLFGGSDPHAAVHQGVEAVRDRAPHATGFANAVLRRLAEAAPSFPWGDPATDDAALARKYGHPLWMVEHLLAGYDRDTVERILAANNTPAPLYVAHNPFKGSFTHLRELLARDGAQAKPCVVSGCLECEDTAAAVRGEALASGLCVVADAAAQFVASLAAVQDDGVVVDLAAGRGTKTLLVQAASGGKAHLLAIDVHDFKVQLLERRMEELAVPNVSATTLDATDTDAVLAVVGEATADVVLLDAPCTGLGTLRRSPDKRWRLPPSDIQELAALASRLLRTATRLVRQGGVVVYSTCTISPAENRGVIEGFLADPGAASFERRSVAGLVPETWGEFVTPEGDFQSLPFAGGPDGHYACILERAKDA